MASAIELLLLASQAGAPSPAGLGAATAPQTVTTATAVSIAGLSAVLGPGTYMIEQRVYFVPSGTIGSSHHHGLSYSGTVSEALFNGVCWQAESTNTATAQSTAAGISGLSGTMLGSPAHAAFMGWATLEGLLVTSTGGTLQATVTLATAGDDITVQAGSWLRATLIP